MNINTLITDMAEAIAQDPDILEWANLYYGRDHYVFVNFDIENPPGESYCPYVVIFPEAKRIGQGIRQRSHTLHVVACVHDDSSRDYPGFTNIIEYEGLQRSEAFRKLVETAMAGVDIGNGLMDFEIDYDSISDFPFFWCFMSAIITEPVTMGSNPLT
ncbi:MAG: hypothetical protein V2I40_07850 [Desulfobacteraceae bacterium]|jgi:hypothetical protein|nr:hypothetical protein [Desulfobacteraceae bacterium]